MSLIPEAEERAPAPTSPFRFGEHIYIGTRSDAMHGAWFDSEEGHLHSTGEAAEIPFAHWMVLHPALPVLYVGGGNDGDVRALSVNRATGELREFGRVNAGGGIAHVQFDEASSTLLVACYSGGMTSSISVLPDGTLGSQTSVVHSRGGGPAPRQDGSHPHSTVVEPGGRFALVADLGADRIHVYPYDRRSGTLSAGRRGDPWAAYVTKPGSGPRSLAFHPALDRAYVLHELTAELEVLAWDRERGRLTHLERVSTNAPSFTGPSSAAEVGLSPDGRYLYCSNRGDHSLSVFAILPDGSIRLVQRVSSGGALPWSFTFHSGGRWLLVANLGSDSVCVFEADAATGELTPTGVSVPVPHPASLRFAGAGRGEALRPR